MNTSILVPEMFGDFGGTPGAPGVTPERLLLPGELARHSVSEGTKVHQSRNVLDGEGRHLVGVGVKIFRELGKIHFRVGFFFEDDFSPPA